MPEAQYLEYMSLPEAERGKDVRLVMANGKEHAYPGKITAIEADFDNTNGNIAFRATFKNPTGILRHGETGNILMDQTLEKALLVPQKATFEVLEHRYVFVVDQEGKIRAQRISVGAELPLVFVVTEGLSPTDRILLDGIRKVKDGQTIKPSVIPAREVFANLHMYAE